MLMESIGKSISWNLACRIVQKENADKVQKKLNLNNKFVTQDLFEIDNYYEFDLINSVGVLHHTNNCLKGIEKIISLSPKYFFIGLYHKYGRKPFLDHFEKIKSDFSNLDQEKLEEKLFKEYKKLDSRKMDDVHLRSWFKDQVIHPYETQHTLDEVFEAPQLVMNVIKDIAYLNTAYVGTQYTQRQIEEAASRNQKATLKQ